MFSSPLAPKMKPKHELFRGVFCTSRSARQLSFQPNVLLQQCPNRCLSKNKVAQGGSSLHTSAFLAAKKSSTRQQPRFATQYQTPRSSNAPIASSPKTSRRAPWPFFWALAAVAFAASIGFTWTRLKIDQEGREASGNAVSEDPSDRYRRTASTFDDDVYWVEKLSGLNRLRKRLVRKASGHVLEASAGTGRNTTYYDLKQCKSITFLDQAAEMTAISHQKFTETAKTRGRFYNNARFVTQSALDPIETPPGGFDTVVQTMGLCSTGDPVGLLKNLGKVVNQDHGRILLLEHGRGIFDFVNQRLDESAAAHADRHGCWWNRDIHKIVQESGLEIVKEKRYLLHLGTTYWYELKPASKKDA